jgi:DNA-binding transcriptional ArsR family regulator
MKDLSYKLFFKAISNKTRFRIIQSLRDGPKNVTQLVKITGFEQSRVSHNLRCLVECGFVTKERVGKNVIYKINRDTILPILELMDKHIEKYVKHLVDCGLLRRKNKRLVKC